MDIKYNVVKLKGSSIEEIKEFLKILESILTTKQ